MKSQPLDDNAFAIRMERLVGPVPPRRLALAVSGGPDSMALALCAQRWAEPRGVALCAFVVDHRLRPESTAEADATRAALEARGLACRILVWDHPPLSTRIEREAREARYRLLFEACRANGFAHLALAHQAEDQAETVLLRFAKGSGIDGLGGIAPKTEREAITLLRPLLDIPRARLIATCAEAGLTPAHDPTNDDTHYARARLRKIAPLLAAEGFTPERLADLAARARDAEEALAAATEAFLKNHVREDAFGVMRLNQAAFALLPREIALRALAATLSRFTPARFAPKREALLRLYENLSLPDAPLFSLSGVLISRKKREITLMREASAQPPRTPIALNVPQIWDHRWRITFDGEHAKAERLDAPAAQPALTLAPCAYEIRPLGLQPKAVLDRLAPTLRKACPEGRARAALPSIWEGEKLIALTKPPLKGRA